jgi:hypothetical protein
MYLTKAICQDLASHVRGSHMLVAFVVGVLTGICLSPIALVPISSLFVLAAVVLWALTGDLGATKILISAGHISLLNVGYLVGFGLRKLSPPRGKKDFLAF